MDHLETVTSRKKKNQNKRQQDYELTYYYWLVYNLGKISIVEWN